MTRIGIVAFCALVAAVPAAPMAEPDACTVLSADDIKTALGRKELAPPKPSRASGGYSDCRFPGAGAGDVRVTLSPALKDAKESFELKPEIYAAEGKSAEKITGVGDGAYYWSDTVEFRVGTRIVSLWVNRTPGTEAPPALKAALINLARRIADRLRAAG